ncbi:response regulator transcription factor [Gracilibacillus salinarum]|uniref:Response regulator n=1 Tax=Gracilibacillus salinarum TaxID=2932255 RepID=A0ABY4GKJ3_9BACI|nr:response regulator [Gracilibacillus salinarum]UOQ84287.1 response regulator [Gracilibacillus salinarum]
MTKAPTGSEILNSFQHFLHYYQASRLTCGIITARADLDPSAIEKLKGKLEKQEPETAFQINYDTELGIVGLLLDGCDLAYTHFYALFVKEFLEQANQLTGPVLVGSFPENSDDAEQMLAYMIEEMTDADNEEKEIKVFENITKAKTEMRSILIVDPDETILQLLKNYLESKEYVVHTAQNGRDGLDQYKKILPDLVITEINLPAIAGYQFINELKQIDEHSNSHSEIIVLTNKELEENIKLTFESGVAEYMTKSFSLIELEARIKRLVKVMG